MPTRDSYEDMADLERPDVCRVITETLGALYSAPMSRVGQQEIDLNKRGVDYIVAPYQKKPIRIDVKVRWRIYTPQKRKHDIHIELFSSINIPHKFEGQEQGFINRVCQQLAEGDPVFKDPTMGTPGWAIDTSKITDEICYFVLDPGALKKAAVFRFSYPKLRESLLNGYPTWERGIHMGSVTYPSYCKNRSPIGNYYSLGLAARIPFLRRLDLNLKIDKPRGNYWPKTKENPDGIDYGFVHKKHGEP